MGISDTLDVELDDLQLQVGMWARRNFGDNKGLEHIAPLLGMMEELGELIHEVLKSHQGIRETNKSNEEDAVGDIMVYLLDFCSRRGLRAGHCLHVAWSEASQRDWVRFPKNGRTE